MRLKNTTFEQVGRLFLQEQEKKLAITTYEKYSSILEKYVIPKIGFMDIDDVEIETIRNMIVSISTDETNSGREGSGLKSGTLKLIDQVTRMVVEYSKRDGENDRSYIEGGDSKSFEKLTPREIEHVCSCAHYNHTPEMLGVLLMLYTGIRIGEICALSCDDIDLDNRSIYIHRSVHRVKNKDQEAVGKTQNVISPIPSQKQVRTVKFPEELMEYIREFYYPQCNLLTANVLPAEAKTVRGRVDRIFEAYRIESIPFQRFHRTYIDGAADIGILRRIFSGDACGSGHVEPINKDWLCQEMSYDLKPLRMLIGMSAQEMSGVIGVTEEEYSKKESGEISISWSEYMALLFFFNHNEKTAAVVESLGLYPDALKGRIVGG